MKISYFAGCLTVAALLSSVAQATLPSQPYVLPSEGDYGVYAVQERALGPSDPFLAKAYDNFTLSQETLLEGLSWTGIYAEPLPSSPSETDFVIEIWADDAGTPDLSAALVTLNLSGGTAGADGPDVEVTQLGHISPATAFTPGAGPAFDYQTMLTPVSLPAGDYWLSILANQSFDSEAPAVDPEWQWHLGSGPSDGFYAFDRLLDPVGTPEYGFLQPDKDLAFALTGTMVPEPQGWLLLLTASLALLRRRCLA